MPKLRVSSQVDPRLVALLVEGYGGRAFKGGPEAGWLEIFLQCSDGELEATYRAHSALVAAECQRRELRRSWAEKRLATLARYERFRREHGEA